ncbi:MAG: tetratricopeptide repeat protein, partial [Dysgonamonadaceae bacterium]|nr:tetratricopeptide repeat protein [Dysgonamonadaceae bacterium]
MRIVAVLFSILSICQGLQAQTYDEWIESSFRYLDANQPDSAEIALKNALRTEPANPVNPFLFNNLGTLQRQMGKNEEALFSYTMALSRHPKNEVFLKARASLFSGMGQLQNALIDYNSLLNEHPDDLESLYQRGLLYLNLKNFEAAENDFARMLALNPNSLYARLGFASLYKI